MQSFVVVPHLAADHRRAALIRRFAEDEGVSAIVPFGDVTGPVLSEGEQLLYRQMADLCPDFGAVRERVAIGQAYLAQGGVAEGYRDAIRFYLSQIVDVEPEGRVVWKEAFFRAWQRLDRMREAFGDRRCLVVADTLVAAEVFAGSRLDYRSAEVGGRILKGVGLSPRDRIGTVSKHVPSEYRGDLPDAVPLEEYAREFHVFVTNVFSPALQRVLARWKWRLTILPGQATDATSFGGAAFAFEAPDTFSLFKCQEGETVRQVYRFVGSDARLFRIDTFDANFKLAGSRDDFDRSPRLFLGRTRPAPAKSPTKKV